MNKLNRGYGRLKREEPNQISREENYLNGKKTLDGINYRYMLLKKRLMNLKT